jgi:hypothetical protein
MGYSKTWMYGAIRHVCRNVDFDAFWNPDGDEDMDAVDIPTAKDAELLAAAPDLRDALQSLLCQFDRHGEDADDPAVKQAMAALKLAGSSLP